MLDAPFIELKFNYTKIGDILPIGAPVCSEDISVGGLVWRVNCYPRSRGCSKELAPEHLSLYLRLLSKPENNVRAIFDAFVMNKIGEPLSLHAGRRYLQLYPPPKDNKEWGWHQFIQWSDLESLHLTDGLITIACGVIVVGDDEPLDVPPSDIGSHLGRLLDCKDSSFDVSFVVSGGTSDIGSHLGRLLDCKDSSFDVSFVVSGETFHAHRALLAARSPVFKAQLLGSMVDAKMSSVTMHDISAATFKAMLRFMYTDALPADDELGASPLSEVFQDLLVMADRYALDRLKLICARKLCENLSTENVCATLACAETYNCPELKKMCITFVAKDENLKKTVLTDGFLQLVQKYPSILAEMREKFGE